MEMHTSLIVFCVSVALALATQAAHADTLSTPSMTGPLMGDQNPTNFDAGPLGTIYLTGAVSGLALWQGNVVPGDHSSLADFSNAQLFVQKTDGWFRFFVEAGGYSMPSLGTPYLHATKATDDLYGWVPQGFIKLVPTDNFSIQIGKLPTLIGAEYTFTVENMNIERGLLWNQEPAVSRGVQANYTAGPLAFSLSWNDGYYSNRYNWISSSVAYAIDGADSLSLVGAGNTSQTKFYNIATPLAQNNSDIFNLIYTRTIAPWIVQPYLQYSLLPKNLSIGIAHTASTCGAGLLVNYTFNSNFNLSGRVEYIDSSGNLTSGAPSLLYGPGSKAWSLTLTPAYQYKIFFARGDLSYVGAVHTTPGFALGPHFTNTRQTRVVLEAGVLF